MKQDINKSPRLYVQDDLASQGAIDLTKDHAHYLMTVMRKCEGDIVRIFNGRDGEYYGRLTPVSKKHAQLTALEQIKPQPSSSHRVHLYFAPIKKDRMAFLIEKAVELGATDIHPVMTFHTENRKPNLDKLQSYIIEATEQCERMDMPVLHNMQALSSCDFVCPTYAAIERGDDATFGSTTHETIGCLIGPEGGWSDDEITFLRDHKNLTPVSLGPRILRAETAALFMLSHIAG